MIVIVLATDLTMQLPDGGIMPIQGLPNPYERYGPIYTSSENDSHALQQNYAYPATSKDYEKPDTYGYSAYIPQQFSSQIPDQSQQIYSNPYYSVIHNNGTIVTDSQNTVQYPDFNQPNINQANLNQTNINQENMNHSNMIQANMNPPNIIQANIPNQYANQTNQPINSNQYSDPGSNQPNMNPNQFAYDPYSTQTTSKPDVVPTGYNQDLNSNFSQMHINASKSEPPSTFGDYTQTYYSVQYPQANTPNSATYSHAPQSANTSMVFAPSDYGSLNYPYSNEGTELGQTPQTSVPYIAEQYFTSSGYSGVSQEYPVYTQADGSSMTNVANAIGASQSFAYPSDANPNQVNPALSHLDAFDKPIKSHTKGEALSSSTYAATFQTYDSNISASQNYTNPSEQSIQNVQPNQMFGNQSEQKGNPNLTSHQVYANPNEQSNLQNTQIPQMFSNQNYPSTSQHVQPSQAFTNPNEQSFLSNTNQSQYSHGYQNHPGYTYDSVTGNYAYGYGSQNSISYDSSAANINPQASSKDPNWSAQGVYTSAGMCETVQSPSLENAPHPEQSANQHIYYNTPYGYITNTSQANQMGQTQSMPTNYGADMNQSTYMQSGQHVYDTNVTFANNQGMDLLS